MINTYQIYLISDSTGETLDRIFTAIKAQFKNINYKISSKSYKKVFALSSSRSEPISYNDFDDYPGLVSTIYNIGGDVIVGFIIDEHGKVIQPEIIDTFNLVLNDVIIDKVKQMKFSPPLQNGRPVRVRYKLPITFK